MAKRRNERVHPVNELAHEKECANLLHNKFFKRGNGLVRTGALPSKQSVYKYAAITPQTSSEITWLLLP